MRKLFLAATVISLTFASAACSKKPAPAAPKTDSTTKPADPAPQPDAPKADAPKDPPATP
jgi:hypothetical protein